MTALRPPRAALSPRGWAIIRRFYPGQILNVVVDRALLELAIRDGHLPPAARQRRRR